MYVELDQLSNKKILLMSARLRHAPHIAGDEKTIQNPWIFRGWLAFGP